jgi:hypothetical protein
VVVLEPTRKAKLVVLRETLNAAIAGGGRGGEDELGTVLQAESGKLAKAGY